MNGLYEISNTGKVRSLKRNIIIQPYKHKSGYLYCCLCKNSKKQLFRIHRLVAKHFIENVNNYIDINHIDGNKHNNNINNLEWCSRSYNIKEAYRNGLMESNFKFSLYNKKGLLNPRCKKINQYDLNNNLIKKWNSIKEIYLQTGYSQAFISGCCKGNHKKAYNFIWKYAEQEEK